MQKMNLEDLWEIWSVFFKIGAVTFGGGMAMLPILDRELCDKRGWITSQELIDYYAIGQATPGIIAVNVATFIGYKKYGTFGGIFATLAIITPSIIIISLIAAFLSNFDKIPVVQKMMSGINVGVAAMLTFTVVNFFRKCVHGIFGVAVFLISFIMLFMLEINTVWVIIFGVAAGFIHTAVIFRKGEAGK